MKDFKPDERLASAMALVRQGARFADIGTDHAYLPLALLREGRIEYAVCSDINNGPLLSAIQNASEAGLSDKMKFVLADGAAHLADEDIEDVAILGMGGELIADIIDRAPSLKSEDVNLILQPMTRQGHLRHYLITGGFEILRELYSVAEGREYVTILAHYTGKGRIPTVLECELGNERFLNTGTPECRKYLERRARTYRKIADGKRRGGDNAHDELVLVAYIEKLLEGGRAYDGA